MYVKIGENVKIKPVYCVGIRRIFTDPVAYKPFIHICLFVGLF